MMLVRRFSALVVLTGLVATSVLLSAPPVLSAPVKRGAAPKGDAGVALAALNRVRKEAGLKGLRIDPLLMTAAAEQARAMADKRDMSHDVAGSFASRMRGRLGFARGAENIAQGYPDVASVVEGWMQSSGHRQNILMSSATRMGIARASGGRDLYWALVLASDEEKPPTMPQASGQPPRGYFGTTPFGIGILTGR